MTDNATIGTSLTGKRMAQATLPPQMKLLAGEIEVADVPSMSTPTAGVPKVSHGCTSLCALLSSENKQILRTC